MFDKDIFKKIDSEEKAYWLGFLEADGCLHSGNGNFRIELGLKAEDYYHLEKYKKFIGKDNKIAYRDKTKSYRYCFRDKTVHGDLIALGCTPTKSLSLVFPNKEQVPDELLLPFLRGYFDGDGSFWFKNKLGMNILSSKMFLEGLKKRCPLLKNISIYPIHYDRSDKGQRIQTGNQEIINQFLYDIYHNATIYLDRKYHKYLNYIATL